MTSSIRIEKFPHFSLECHYDASPGDPGRYSGPPEHCYPEEPPSCEITEVFLVVGETRVNLTEIDFIGELDCLADYFTRLEDKILNEGE